jgi:hypothetical protein
MAAPQVRATSPATLTVFQRLAGMMFPQTKQSATGQRHGDAPRHSSAARAPLKLSAPLVAWLGDMADLHNFGSRNKTVRDLLCYYAGLHEEDLKHVLSNEGRAPELDESEPSADVHVTRQHAVWLAGLGKSYGLSADIALAHLVSFAQSQLDDDVVFEQDVCCASTTFDLYNDCDIYTSLP